MKLRCYTGVGSRETPEDILNEMREIAAALARAGFCLRSGAAPGADTAFEQGAVSVPGAPKQIFLPWKGFNGNSSPLIGAPPRAFELAKSVHPAWDRLGQGPQKLHARNSLQALGPDLDDPSEATICWTPDGATCEAETSRHTGGTGTAIKLSSRHGVPVFNLANRSSRQALSDWLEKLGIRGVLKLAPSPPTQLGLL